jgi:hypothetical protein
MTSKSWLLFAVCGLAAASVWLGGKASAEVLSCKDRLVKLGSSQYDVTALCGPPDGMQQRTELRPVRRQVRVPCAAGLCTTVIEDAIEVPVEEWVYDFGTQRFLQYLTFEGGTLIRVKAGGYGHKEQT